MNAEREGFPYTSKIKISKFFPLLGGKNSGF
jgi:hypothetical protein